MRSITSAASASSSIIITDPLVKYQSLLATGACSPDPAQHRLAIHLRTLYLRLRDYSPPIEYQFRLQAISRTLEKTSPRPPGDSRLAEPSHPIWRNPLFSRLLGRVDSGENERRALTRVLTSSEGAKQIDSPRGLFLSGEVGRGKSMLLDLLAQGLPAHRRRRWHFNTFVLHVLARLEHHRRLRAQEQAHSLVWVGRELVSDAPVLFLDELQLPDRAASKMVSHLLTVYFQLGGVLIASSNRIPQELEKAAGSRYRYERPAAQFISKMLGKGDGYQSDAFANFLEVLKARCDFWQMEGTQDWRRREKGDGKFANAELLLDPHTNSGGSQESRQEPTSTGIGHNNLITTDNNADDAPAFHQKPKTYFLVNNTDDVVWTQALDSLLPRPYHTIPWTPKVLTVYGRQIIIPRQHDGIAYWDLSELVSTHGPADYITMASNYHTFVIDHIPVLTIDAKNEARRFITLLDALYEARCRLIVRATAGPDTLFFPSSISTSSSPQSSTLNANDSILSETISEVYQDATSPFRPNISEYAESISSAGEEELSNDDVSAKRVDFANTGAFTGEDERFAYKRAASRLWELCSASWHASGGDEGWAPLPVEARHWEGGEMAQPLTRTSESDTKGGGKNNSDEGIGDSVELDELAGLQKLRVEEMRKAMEQEIPIEHR